MSVAKSRPILEGYDEMMRNALYDDTRNYYLTATVFIACSMIQSELSRKENADFFELILSVSLCTKLRYPEEIPRKWVQHFNEYLDEEQPLSFNSLVRHMCGYLQKFIPGFTYYVHEDRLYSTKSGMDDWASVVGPLLWTWGHLTFANLTSIAERRQALALILIFDVILGCSICRNHYMSYKSILFGMLSEEIESYDAESMFLKIHSFVSVCNKFSRTGFVERLALWEKVAEPLRLRYVSDYRQLEKQLHTI